MLWVVAITSFMGTFLISSVNIALPAMGQDFALDAVKLSWVVTSFLLATAMFLLPAGRWGDRSGIRRLFRAGLVVFTLASLGSGLAGSGAVLILFRFLQGVGAACTSTTGPAILVSGFPPAQRGRVLGISVSAVYLGLATGPFAGGMITQYLGWRTLFYLAALLGLMTAILAFRWLGRDTPGSGSGPGRAGMKGVLLYMLGLFALVYGSSSIPSARGWLLMAAGLATLVWFWRVQQRSEAPIVDTALFAKNRLFAFSNLAALINYSATFAIVFLLSLYLQKVQGMPPRDAGAILLAQPLMMALFSPLAGRLSDRIQPRYLATAGMGMCTAGLAAMTGLSESTPSWVLIAMLVWVGLGFALFSSPNMNTIMGSVLPGQLGQASGSAATMRVVGQIVSMTVATLFFAGLFGGQAMELVPTPLFMRALRWSFTCFALLCSLGIWFSFRRGELHRPVPED